MVFAKAEFASVMICIRKMDSSITRRVKRAGLFQNDNRGFDGGSRSEHSPCIHHINLQDAVTDRPVFISFISVSY